MYNYLIALGSNLKSGKLTRMKILEQALTFMSGMEMHIVIVSSWWESKAFPPGAGPNYINGVTKVLSDLKPKEMLKKLKKIEKISGRESSKRWENRVLDLDLLACDNMILPTKTIFLEWLSLPSSLQLTKEPKQLILPHPRIQDRLFVLKPLHEVAPTWTHPILGKKPQELMDGNVWESQDFLKRL